MSGQSVCKKCGKALKPEDLVCDACGTIAGGLAGGAGLTIPDVALPGTPSFVTGLGSTSFAPMADVGRIDSTGLNLNFGTSAAGQGRPYKPVFAIGRGKEGGEALRMPFALALLPTGGFLIIHFLDDGGRTELWRCSADGRRIGTTGPFPAGSADDALDAPAAIAADERGDVYVLDMGASLIKKFSPEGRPIARFGGVGTEHELLETPEGLAVDTAGSLYVADTGNNRILKWDAQGRFQMAIGIDKLDTDGGGMMSGNEPGELDEPKGLCLDSQGDIYVADSNNHRIQVFSPVGALKLAFGEEGAEPGRLYYPRVVRLNAQGDIYVADSKQGRVQKFNPEGQFVYQVVAPSDAGLVDDFLVDPSGRLVLALRNADLVLGIEIE